MGRTVSRPSNAAVIVCAEVDHSSYYCRTCAHCREEETEAEAGTHCARCEAKNRIPDIQFDEFTARENWHSDMDNLTYALRKAFPSLNKADRWIGREDHVILENRHGCVPVSEYCGRVAVCLVPEARSEYERPPMIAHHWCTQAEPKFRKIVVDTFGGSA